MQPTGRLNRLNGYRRMNRTVPRPQRVVPVQQTGNMSAKMPIRNEKSTAKRARFRLAESKWTDKIFLLKYIIFWLVILIVLLAAALALCICMLLQVTPDWINELLMTNPPISFLVVH